jgi:hypothetical protein
MRYLLSLDTGAGAGATGALEVEAPLWSGAGGLAPGGLDCVREHRIRKGPSDHLSWNTRGGSQGKRSPHVLALQNALLASTGCGGAQAIVEGAG